MSVIYSNSQHFMTSLVRNNRTAKLYRCSISPRALLYRLIRQKMSIFYSFFPSEDGSEKKKIGNIEER
jgi:hypothetical protein